MTDHLEIFLLSYLLDRDREGVKQVDVFDMTYETSRAYAEVKNSLDGLCSAGQVRQVGLRFYELACDAAELEKQLVEQAAEIKKDKDVSSEEKATDYAERLKILRRKYQLLDEEDDGEDEEEDEEEDDDEEYSDLFNDGGDNGDDIGPVYYQDPELAELREKLDSLADSERESRMWSYNSLVLTVKDRASSGLLATLERACQLVYYYRLKYATPDILVYAMMLSPCTACNLLAYGEVDFAEFGKRALKIIDSSPTESRFNLHGFDMQCRIMLKRAMALATPSPESLRDVCSEDLLYVLIFNNTSVVRLLNDMGVDLDKIKQLLRGIVDAEG